MNRSVLTALLLAASTAGTACTTGSAIEGGGPAPAPRRSTVITAEEIATSQTATAFEAVRELRPHWLQARGPDLITVGGRLGAQVAIDDVMRGQLDELRDHHEAVGRADGQMGRRAERRWFTLLKPLRW